MAGFPKKYSDDLREKAVRLYLATTNESHVAELTGVPRETIKEWRKTQWWRDTMKEVIVARDFQMQQDFSTVIEEAVDVVRDRLQHGDVVLDKAGNEKRKPISVRDAALVAAIFHDKRRDSRNQETQLENHQTTQQVLNSLMETFSGLAKKPKEKEIIDAEFTELQTELQTGGSSGG